MNIGNRVVFHRNNTQATVADIKTTGQPYKLRFADGGCIWASACAVIKDAGNKWLNRKAIRRDFV